jgi:hypothetical protein
VRLCKDSSARVVGRQCYARATTALHLDPGHCDCRDRPGGGPLPIQPPPGETQFAQTMPELGRQHRYMGAAPNPRILTGWFGASSHGLWFPVRAFLRFPVCPAGLFPFVRLPPVSLRLALSGSVPSAVAVRFGSPPVSLRVPFPLSNLHVSAAARRFCGRWSRAAGTKVTSSRRDPWLRSRRSARNADVPPGGDRVVRRGGRFMALDQALMRRTSTSRTRFPLQLCALAALGGHMRRLYRPRNSRACGRTVRGTGRCRRGRRRGRSPAHYRAGGGPGRLRSGSAPSCRSRRWRRARAGV